MNSNLNHFTGDERRRVTMQDATVILHKYLHCLIGPLQYKTFPVGFILCTEKQNSLRHSSAKNALRLNYIALIARFSNVTLRIPLCTSRRHWAESTGIVSSLVNSISRSLFRILWTRRQKASNALLFLDEFWMISFFLLAPRTSQKLSEHKVWSPCHN